MSIIKHPFVHQRPQGRPETLRRGKALEEYQPSRLQHETRVVTIALDFPEGKIEAEIPLTSGRERLVVLAFKMLQISSEVADMAARDAAKLGHRVSCKKGCGACCRQLVPLSPPEAVMIFEFVESMPEPRKDEVKNRFSVATRHLKKRGLLETLEGLESPLKSEEEYQIITREYLGQNIACPFLVDECCSIHAVRPSMCREYLVTSPAENCNDPDRLGLRRVPVSIRLSEALARTWASVTVSSRSE